MDIKLANESDSKEWDLIVENSPHGTIFHTWKWLKIVEKHTKTKLYPLIGLKGEEPIGIFPLFYYKKLFIKMVFSPPIKALLLYLGPIVVGHDKLKPSKVESNFIEFQKKVDEFIKLQFRANVIRIRTSPNLLDSRPFKWSGYEVEPLYTYMVDLDKGAEYVWKQQFDKQLRKNINKTISEGVSVDEGSKKDLDFLCSSLTRRFNEQSFKTSGFHEDYLSEIYDSFHATNLKIFVAEYNGENIGGVTLLYYKNKASLWVGTPKISLKGIYPNDLVVWESIKWACDNGFTKYEIMDSGSNPRLQQFKSKFNLNLSIWFSATKYSPSVLEALEKNLIFIYNKFRLTI